MTRALRSLFGAIAMLAVCASTVVAAAPRSYSGANEAYEQGRWDDAIAGYEALVGAGLAHEDLYFNLGNAYLRADRLGPAIFNYERALRLAPGFADAKHNLRIARDEVAKRWQDRMKSAEKETSWVRVVTYLSSGTLTLLFLAANLVFFAGLVGSRLLPRGGLRLGVLATSAVAGLVTIALAVLLWGNVNYTQKVKHGVVLDDRLHMRDGAYEQSVEGAQIHAGLRVRIIGRESGWVNIRLTNGHEGWVPTKSIGEL